MTTTRSVTIARATDIKQGELAAFDVEGVRIAVANANGRYFAIDGGVTLFRKAFDSVLAAVDAGRRSRAASIARGA